ncbi:hypothetical protein HK103_006169 [Boothiomyces macroporosus]|uniref:Uncharacterized protein n=1 Tax=Boothiomyces macroporosus TaxID=261099 RepID=A0AAD5UEI4_9FUNG|nr:hypothetical protein HK103_006169 [Boothiomyces macroporosus]
MSEFVSTDTSLNANESKKGFTFGNTVKKLSKFMSGSKASLNKPVHQETDISEATFRNSVKRIPSAKLKGITTWFSKGKSKVTEKEKNEIERESTARTKVYKTEGMFEDRESEPVDPEYLESMQREYASSVEDATWKVPFHVGSADIYTSPTVEMLPRREDANVIPRQRSDSLKRADSIDEFQGRRQGIYIPTTLKEAKENPTKSAFDINREHMVSSQDDAFKISDADQVDDLVCFVEHPDC